MMAASLRAALVIRAGPVAVAAFMVITAVCFSVVYMASRFLAALFCADRIPVAGSIPAVSMGKSRKHRAGCDHADNSRRCDHLSAYSHIVHLLSYIPIPRHAPAKKAAPDLFPGLLAPSASVSSYHRQSDYSSYFCMIHLRVSRRRSGRQTAP